MSTGMPFNAAITSALSSRRRFSELRGECAESRVRKITAASVSLIAIASSQERTTKFPSATNLNSLKPGGLRLKIALIIGENNLNQVSEWLENARFAGVIGVPSLVLNSRDSRSDQEQMQGEK